MRRAWVIVLCTSAALADDNPYTSLLRSRGVAPDPPGLAAFLHRSIPNERTRGLIRALIADLEGEDAAAREAAVRHLGRIPFLADKAVRAAAESGDPEVRRLCKRILEGYRTSRYDEVLNAVFHTIRLQRIKGFAPLLLRALPLPHCEERYLRHPAGRALAASARTSDADLLRKALGSRSRMVRAAAAEALHKVTGKGAVEDLTPLLADPDDGVRLVAAKALATLGERSSLTTLAELLGSASARVRFRASALLRALTGKRFGYASYLDPPQRAAAAGQWSDFIRKQGASVRMRLPLPMLLGRTLVCSITGKLKRLEEYDRSGKRTFQTVALAVPWGCMGLPNGHRLVAVFSARVVVEYDAGGREVWRTELLPGPPVSVRRLATGNTLIACSDSHQVVEVDAAGRVAWSVTVTGRPIDARPLQNDRTLVTLYQGKRVVEVDRAGAIVWELKGQGTPSTAERLADGNTLVAGLDKHSQVTEYDRNGRIVWSLDVQATVYEAQRLRNGNTLVGTSNGAREYDARGRVVWKKDVGACRVMRY